MNIHFFNKKGLFVIVILSIVFLLFYMPFCCFMDTHVEHEDTEDKCILYENRILHYGNCLFLLKGQSYNLDHNTKVKFNWNNSISIRNNGNKYVLSVDSINIIPSIADVDKLGDVEAMIHVPKSEYYCCIEFYDNKKNYVKVYRKKKASKARKRLGFEIKIGNFKLMTGNNSYFDY